MADLQKKMITFGIDKLEITKLLTDDSSGATYNATLNWLEGCQDLKITETSEQYKLEGDNGIVDVRTRVTGYEVEIVYGAMTFEQIQMIKGGTVNEIKDAGGTNVIKREYIIKQNDQNDYFGLIGTIESSGKKVILPKVKATSVEIPYSNLTHAVVTIKATAIKRDFDGVMQKWIQEDPLNITPSSVTDFDVV